VRPPRPLPPPQAWTWDLMQSDWPQLLPRERTALRHTRGVLPSGGGACSVSQQRRGGGGLPRGFAKAAGDRPACSRLASRPRAAVLRAPRHHAGRTQLSVKWSREHAARLTRLHEGRASGRAQPQALLAAARAHLPAQALFLDSCRGLGSGSALLADFAALRSLDLSWCCDLQAGSLARVGCGASKPLTPRFFKVLTAAQARCYTCFNSSLLSRVYCSGWRRPQLEGLRLRGCEAVDDELLG